ncbi:hypothetical protein VTI28DRAFT_3647 [Corynascus sepedonium]
MGNSDANLPGSAGNMGTWGNAPSQNHKQTLIVHNAAGNLGAASFGSGDTRLSLSCGRRRSLKLRDCLKLGGRSVPTYRCGSRSDNPSPSLCKLGPTNRKRIGGVLAPLAMLCKGCTGPDSAAGCAALPFALLQLPNKGPVAGFNSTGCVVRREVERVPTRSKGLKV